MKAHALSNKTSFIKWMIVISWFIGATLFANVAYAAKTKPYPVKPGKSVSKKGLYGKPGPIKRNLKRTRPVTYRACH